jgi:hypothetical protein
MTDQSSAITPPPELVEKWADMLSSRSDYAVFSLAIQWGADQARAALAQLGPVVVSVAVSDALIKAECALSDVAEGEPECDDGDPAQWAEQRCAETLAIIRPVMKLHKIRTSEWPPQPNAPKPP